MAEYEARTGLNTMAKIIIVLGIEHRFSSQQPSQYTNRATYIPLMRLKQSLGSRGITALDGGEWLPPHPCRFTPGEKSQYSLVRRLGGPQSRSGRCREEENLAPAGIRT
jgi:hypothetical protein